MNDNYPGQQNKISEFNYTDNINKINTNIENNNKNIYKNDSYIDNNNNISISFLKYWLSNLGLLDYLNNFI